MKQKQCSKCGEWKLLDKFHKHKVSKDGYKSQCKICRRQYMREYQQRAEVKERIQSYDRQYRQDNKEYLSQKSKEYHHTNKDKHNAQARHWHHTHKEKAAQLGAKYREKNKELIKLNKQRYRQDNIDRIINRDRQYYQDNKERLREEKRKYHKTQRGKSVLRTGRNNRRARLKGLPNTLTAEQWQHALNYFNGRCTVCGRQINDIFGEFTASADHWIPLSYKGDDNPGTVAGNIIPLCCGVDGCNNSKRAAMPDVWLERKFGAHEAKQIAAKIQTYFDSLE